MVQNRCCLLKGGEVNLVWVFLVCCSCWLAPMMLMWVSSSSALLFCGVSLSSWRARCPNAPVMLLPNYFTLLILCSFFAVHCIRSLTRAIGTFWIVRCALLVGIVFWMLRPDGTVPRSRQHKLNLRWFLQQTCFHVRFSECWNSLTVVSPKLVRHTWKTFMLFTVSHTIRLFFCLSDGVKPFFNEGVITWHILADGVSLWLVLTPWKNGFTVKWKSNHLMDGGSIGVFWVHNFVVVKCCRAHHVCLRMCRNYIKRTTSYFYFFFKCTHN